MRSFIVFVSVIVLLAGCQSSKSGKQGQHEVIVTEAIQAAGYTYLHVKENDREMWLAAPEMEAKAGEKYYYKDGLKIANFQSRELNRSFDTIIMVERISKEPIPDTKAPVDKAAVSPHKTMPAAAKQDIKIEPAKDGITIAKLYSDLKSYAGKKVIIKGQVVKFNPGIMDKNWIHIQDGTEFDGKFDLTITTGTNVEAGVGDVYTFEGKISLDRDFGAGYAYDVILEDGWIK